MAGAHTLARRPALLPPVPRERARKEAKRERGVARPGATLVLVPLQRHESLKLGTFKPFGPKFLSFLEHKVLPAIEGKHRIDSSQRVLTGSSAGSSPLMRCSSGPSCFSPCWRSAQPRVGATSGSSRARKSTAKPTLFANELTVCKRTHGLQTNHDSRWAPATVGRLANEPDGLQGVLRGRNATLGPSPSIETTWSATQRATPAISLGRSGSCRGGAAAARG